MSDDNAMLASELIAMLRCVPADTPVRLAYDSMVMIYDLRPSRCFIVRKEGGLTPGLYLCAMGDESVKYHREDEGGEAIL